MAEERDLQELIRFHGHMCVGLALGVRAAEVGLKELGAQTEPTDLIVQVETGTCSVDAIQALTGCTSGNGKLHFKDYAKNVYTFWRMNGRAVRVVALPDSFRSDAPGFWDLFARIQAGTATDEERSEFAALQRVWSERVLDAPEPELFRVEEVTELPPTRSPITRQVLCQSCGEAVMEHRAEKREGEIRCFPCARSPERR